MFPSSGQEVTSQFWKYSDFKMYPAWWPNPSGYSGYSHLFNCVIYL